VGSYLITGGAGFIGSHIATRLGRAGHDVRVLDNLSGSGAHERAARLADVPHLTLLQGDIRDSDVCHKACAGVDFVLHQAAETSLSRAVADPVRSAEVNVIGTLNLLTAARDVQTVRRFVFASSSTVYGDTPAMSKHEAGAADPISPDATSKLAGEHYCRNFYRMHRLSTVSLRYFSVYGPGESVHNEEASVISQILSQSHPQTIDGDGEQSRDFMYVDDIIEANLRAVSAQRGVSGKVFNIGAGQRTSLNQLREQMERLLALKIELRPQEPQPSDIKHLRADTAAAAGLLHFAPTVTLEDGLARTLQWYRQSTIEGELKVG
jgi:nucleoside-diphosphate-sugar epimerase